MAYRKCKKCGRRFEHKGAGDGFCSDLCRMTGFFVGGGGDTSKPGVKSRSGEAAPSQSPCRAKKGEDQFQNVRNMFELPESERWTIARSFTDEERAYARRIAKRMLMAEDRFVREWSWTDAETSEEGFCDLEEEASEEGED